MPLMAIPILSATKSRPGEFTCLDEVLSLLSATEFHVDENLKVH